MQISPSTMQHPTTNRGKIQKSDVSDSRCDPGVVNHDISKAKKVDKANLRFSFMKPRED